MNLPLAPLLAAVLGLLAGFGVAAMPLDALEGLVMDSGLPAVVAAAEPPLGFTARALLTLGVGALTAGFAWVMLFILLGSRGIVLGDVPRRDGNVERAPVLRRADAHPDAPPRPPLRAARDLGTPFLEVRAPGARPDAEEIAAERAFAADFEFGKVAALRMSADESEWKGAAIEFARTSHEVEEVAVLREIGEVALHDMEEPALVERALPDDLGQPLAAFDPQAIPETPLPPPVTPRPVPKPPLFDAGERFEAFELAPRPASKPAARPVPMPAPRPVPMGAPQPASMRVPAAEPAPITPPAAEAPIAQPETEASVHALLDRLERGVLRQALASKPQPTPRPRSAERGLEEALVTLRNLARRA